MKGSLAPGSGAACSQCSTAPRWTCTTLRPGRSGSHARLLTDGGPPPILLGVQGDLVVYETGGALHLLRLSDGRDKALLIPGAAPWLDASLEPGGLFVSWNKMHDRRPGRIAFIPLRMIAGRL